MLLNEVLLLVLEVFDLSIDFHLLLVEGGSFFNSLVQEGLEIIQVVQTVHKTF